MVRSLRSRVDRFAPGRIFMGVVIPLFCLYLTTASFGRPYHIDAFTNVLTAWHVAARGSIYLDDSPDLAGPAAFRNVGWFVRTDEGHVVSQYPPGAAATAVPLYLFARSSQRVAIQGNNIPDAPPVTLDLPSLVPAAIAASLVTALAMGLLALAFLALVSPSDATASAYVAGLGTAAWSVASDSLWQHGPAMLWIALGLYLMSRDHQLGAGLSFGMGVLTRPHVALVAAAVGIGLTISRRSIKPVVQVGAGSCLGLAALLLYNAVVFGTPSISGGYSDAFLANTLSSDYAAYLRNIVLALFDPQRGLLIWAPFLIILIPGLAKAWRVAPDWARGAAIGGVLYLLLQLKANRFTGGGGFFAYRYPLEALTAAAPLFVLAWREWVAKKPLRVPLFTGGVILATVGQAIGAILY